MALRLDTTIPDPTDANLVPATLPAADIVNRIDHLSYLSEGLNGPNTFSIESASYGYIERHKRLIIPEDVRVWIRENKISWETNDAAAPVSVVTLFSVMFWNYARLLQGGYTKDNAFFVSAYRTRLIYLGYLYESKEDRSVTIDEVDYSATNRSHHHIAMEDVAAYATAHNAATTEEEQVRAYVAHGPNDRFKRFLNMVTTAESAEVMKFLTLASNQFAAATYLVFRQHGHHYTAELDKKLNVLWKATTLAQSPKYPGNEAVHRDAIHSFGMKSLHEKFFYYLDKGKLAETFVDRSDVSPAGTAMIGTCWAAINLMKSLPLWNDLYSQYKTQIDILEEQAGMLKLARDAIKYHKNARLFGQQRHVMNTEVAQALAPIAVGFINSLGDEADLAQQKTLHKRANQNPLMTQLTYGVIRTVVTRIQKSGEMRQALNAPTTARITEIPESEPPPRALME